MWKTLKAMSYEGTPFIALALASMAALAMLAVAVIKADWILISIVAGGIALTVLVLQAPVRMYFKIINSKE